MKKPGEMITRSEPVVQWRSDRPDQSYLFSVRNNEKDLRKLRKRLTKKIKEKAAARYLRKQQLLEVNGWMANFMAGVTWALLCRAVLRRSKGHNPDFGTNPQSGEMWWPWEIVDAAHCWPRRNPLLAMSWKQIVFDNPLTWESDVPSLEACPTPTESIPF